MPPSTARDAASTAAASTAGDRPPLTRDAVFTVVFSALSGFLFGYDLCVINVALDLITDYFSLDTASTEAVVSLVFVGATFGSLAGGPFTDHFGRRLSIALCSFLYCIGAVIMGAAGNVGILFLGRLVVGFAVGASTITVSVFIAEISHPKWRGVLVSINEVSLCAGCLFAVTLDAQLADIPGGEGWRWMLGLSGAVALIQLIGCAFLPESPRWLLLVGRVDDARSVLLRLRGQDQRAALEHELVEMTAAIAEERGDGVGVKEALTAGSVDALGDIRVEVTPGVAGGSLGDDSLDESETTTLSAADGGGGGAATGGAHAAVLSGSNLRETVSAWSSVKAIWAEPGQRAALLLAVGIAMAQNFTAANALLYYSTHIFREAGVTDPMFASVGIAGAKLVGVAFALVLVQRFGRRTIMLWGTAAECLALVTLSVAFAAAEEPALGPTVVSALFFFILAWNMSWAPLMFVICGEVLPGRARGVGMGLALTAFWVTSSITNQVLLSLIEWISSAGAFALFACTTAAAWVFVYHALPETRNRSLEDIAATFRERAKGGRHATFKEVELQETRGPH